MPVAFIIMQIGNDTLDKVCKEAIVPALEACGLEPKRVDKHTEGGLLKSEIIRFIQEADILVADLTSERPNVYLEIGFAMGIDKFRNLILTVREDHFPDSPNHKMGGPRVHFDLAGYDILRWDAADIGAFKTELEKRIRRRLAITSARSSEAAVVWDQDWISAQRQVATTGLTKLGTPGFMELRSALQPPKINKTQTELSEATRQAPIHTFGWPIGVYLFNRPEARPKPRADGIVAELFFEDTKDSYDYWALRRDGDFYFLGSLFEDERKPGHLFFNTRIIRVTEALLYCARLYSFLGVDRSTRIELAIRHGGLGGRVLTSSNPSRHLSVQHACDENEVETGISCTLDDIEASLVEKVEEIVAPLFRLFDFFELSHEVYSDIVNRFVRGEVS